MVGRAASTLGQVAFRLRGDHKAVAGVVAFRAAHPKRASGLGQQRRVEPMTWEGVGDGMPATRAAVRTFPYGGTRELIDT